MALSLREKSTISRRIKENAAKLSAGGLSLREKSTVSRAIKEDVALLIGDTLLVPQPLSAIDTDPDLETFTAEDLIPDGPDELSSADYLRQMASKAPTRQSFFNLVVMKVNGASKEDRQQIQELFGLEHPPKGLAELRAASDKFYDSQKGQRKQRRENYKAALAQSKQRQNEQFLAGISDTARDSNAAMNAHIESVNKFYREKGIDHALPFDMAAKQYDYADWKQSQAAQNPDLETFTETDPNVALLQDIAKGQYSHLDSEALLDKAEPAARAVDVASYSELVGEAMGEWLNVDNKAYALDSVRDTRNIIGWFEN